jgi:hypothetical protein
MPLTVADSCGVTIGRSLDLIYYIDRFVSFDSLTRVSGWVVGDSPLQRVSLVASGKELGACNPLPSPDVAAHYPAKAHAKLARFDIRSVSSAAATLDAMLRIHFTDSSVAVISKLGTPSPSDAGHACYGNFLAMIGRMPPGNFLEIGARARSGVTRREVIPPAWDYTGFDIIAGPNVDVVGDAHALSQSFPRLSFDAVMAISVLEHILMPWKMVLELNAVMRLGGIALFHTHQAWPLHDEPWDFWRFSKDAWPALFNAKTGFEILQAGMGEPTFFVPLRVQASTNFDEQLSYLVSSVIVRKTSETMLSWDVNLRDAVDTAYPA